MSNSTFDVFISYSHRDLEWVRDWLLPRLEAAGLRVCIDFRDFKIGVPSLDNMADAAVRSGKTLFVMTPNWTVSEFSQFEALVTQTIDPIGRKGRLLPLMLKDCDLPMRLQILTYADFRDAGSWETEFARVVKAIKPEPLPEQARGESKAPTQNLVHPYPIQANFTGRVREREELTEWLADDARPICALVAMGGMGKSALAWVWVKNDVLGDTPTGAAPAVDGVMWWSFYEGESSFARFVDEALRYVGARPIDAATFPTTYDRAQELRRLLQSKRILFVLDGFERQLRTYAGLDAAYKQDATAEESRDARSCVDPNAARFVRYIAAVTTRAKLLLTTRLMPGDLEDRAGDPLAGALKRELKELLREDALAFMHSQGVTKGTDVEIAAACADYGYHPLSIRLLSGLIARDTRTPGDISAAPRHDVHADLIQRQHHVLEQSYNALPEQERTLLSCIAAFRNPTTYDALSIFNTLGNEARFDDALEDLRARGLLQRDLAHNRYDLHPIVRHYAYNCLNDKTDVHTRLRDYFASITESDEENVQSLEDLSPIIELYHHTVRAGHYNDAVLLFHRRLSQALYFRFGTYQLNIELLLSLFPDGEAGMPQVTVVNSKAWTINELANSYSSSGQPRHATLLFERVNALVEEAGDQVNLGLGLRNIAMQQHGLGEIKVAELNIRRSIELFQAGKEEYLEAISHRELGAVLLSRGDFDGATQSLDVALKMFGESKDFPRVGTVWEYRALRALIISDSRAALDAARQARRLADEVARTHYPVERDFIRAEWLLGAALLADGNDLNDAAVHLAEALTRCRRINHMEVEPDILLAWARWHQACGNRQEAQAYAEEALAIADRCEYRLAQAGIRNFLARLALDVGEREAARGHAEVARERAWCDGPPYCYRVALDEADGLLRELGVGEEK